MPYVVRAQCILKLMLFDQVIGTTIVFTCIERQREKGFFNVELLDTCQT